ncbi:MAG: hypothetical protein KAQ93_00585 [Spirochaetales bacterium]|nr:hypothetical protein [Spirochaetales bacterium]
MLDLSINSNNRKAEEREENSITSKNSRYIFVKKCIINLIISISIELSTVKGNGLPVVGVIEYPF